MFLSESIDILKQKDKPKEIEKISEEELKSDINSITESLSTFEAINKSFLSIKKGIISEDISNYKQLKEKMYSGIKNLCEDVILNSIEKSKSLNTVVENMIPDISKDNEFKIKMANPSNIIKLYDSIKSASYIESVNLYDAKFLSTKINSLLEDTKENFTFTYNDVEKLKSWKNKLSECINGIKIITEKVETEIRDGEANFESCSESVFNYGDRKNNYKTLLEKSGQVLGSISTYLYALRETENEIVSIIDKMRPENKK